MAIGCNVRVCISFGYFQGTKGILSILSEEEIAFEFYQKVDQRMRIQTVLQDEEFREEEQSLFSF